MPTPHPTDDQWQAYFTGRADLPTQLLVDEHLSGCAHCRTRPQPSPRTPTPMPYPSRTGTPGPGWVPPPGSPVVPPELLAISQYTNVRWLGEGGMGAVYLAENHMMDRQEVLKVLTREYRERADLRDRFLREVRSAARLGHPNVVTSYNAFWAGDLLVYAMEYVPGRNLADLVRENGPLAVPTACDYVFQAAQGLQHAHERGMVHRDIKPGNLMLLVEGRRQTVKVLDFGLAKPAGGSRQDVTAAGQMLGTPAYMAPEQARDAASADIRADIYALGCTLHYLLTGDPPFRHTVLLDLLLAHREEAPPRLNELRADVHPELADAVDRLLAKQPADRPPTPAEAAKLLDRFRPGRAGTRATPVPPPPPPPPPPSPLPRPIRIAERLVELTPEPPPPPPVATPLPLRDEPPVRRRGILKRVGRFLKALVTWLVILAIWGGTIRFFQLMFFPFPGDRRIAVIAEDYLNTARGWVSGSLELTGTGKDKP